MSTLTYEQLQSHPNIPPVSACQQQSQMLLIWRVFIRYLAFLISLLSGKLSSLVPVLGRCDVANLCYCGAHLWCGVLRSSSMMGHNSFMMWRTSFMVRRSTFMVWCSTFMVWRSSFMVRRSSFMEWRSSFYAVV